MARRQKNCLFKNQGTFQQTWKQIKSVRKSLKKAKTVFLNWLDADCHDRLHFKRLKSSFLPKGLNTLQRTLARATTTATATAAARTVKMP
jgi:hypothetical protein